MPLTRLFLLLILCVFCAGAALAQSQRNLALSIASQDAASTNSSEYSGAHQSQSNSATQADSDSQAKSERNLADRADHQSGSRFIPGPETPLEKTCLFIRDYRVVRDNPRSDSTHRDGYTTCVPAVRFQVYATTERTRR